MLVVGVILTIAGVAGALYGVAQVANLIAPVFSFEANMSVFGLESYLVWVIAGAIVAIIGIILMAARKKPAKSAGAIRLLGVPDGPGGEPPPAVVASAVEFVLEGLHLHRRINKDRAARGTIYRR
jgi:predicted cobalt transporter CbtA